MVRTHRCLLEQARCGAGTSAPEVNKAAWNHQGWMVISDTGLSNAGRVTHIFELIDRPSEERQLLLHSLREITKLVTLGTVVGVLTKLLSKQLLLQSLCIRKYYVNMIPVQHLGRSGDTAQSYSHHAAAVRWEAIQRGSSGHAAVQGHWEEKAHRT